MFYYHFPVILGLYFKCSVNCHVQSHSGDQKAANSEHFPQYKHFLQAPSFHCWLNKLIYFNHLEIVFLKIKSEMGIYL